MVGTGLLVGWLDIEPADQPLFDEWYDEHLAERIAVPGFLRARRFETVEDPGPLRHYLTVYELTDASVLSTPDYLDRKYHPTPLTNAVGPRIRNGGRTAYRMVSSAGRGIGGCLAVVMSSSQPVCAVQAGTLDRLPGQLADARGVVGAALFSPDVTATRSAPESEATFDPMHEADGLLLLVEMLSVRYCNAVTGILAAHPVFGRADKPEIEWYSLLTCLML
jgi:hypothetical protein